MGNFKIRDATKMMNSVFIKYTRRLNTTRPDTRPPVANGWEERKCAFSHFSTRAHQRTDGRKDGRTKPLIELRVRN